MLTFNLKKEWFEKIKSGEKTHEYREVKPYWSKRIFKTLKKGGGITASIVETCIKNSNRFSVSAENYPICFVLGYAGQEEKEKRLYGRISRISLLRGVDALNTDLKINKPVYDIEFKLIKENLK